MKTKAFNLHKKVKLNKFPIYSGYSTSAFSFSSWSLSISIFSSSPISSEVLSSPSPSSLPSSSSSLSSSLFNYIHKKYLNIPTGQISFLNYTFMLYIRQRHPRVLFSADLAILFWMQLSAKSFPCFYQTSPI